jgi:hypothetical protein
MQIQMKIVYLYHNNVENYVYTTDQKTQFSNDEYIYITDEPRVVMTTPPFPLYNPKPLNIIQTEVLTKKNFMKKKKL